MTATPPRPPIEAGTPLTLGLRLLDHQILGREQEMLGNVDDALLEIVVDRARAAAPSSGPAGLGPRFGGPDVCMRSIGGGCVWTDPGPVGSRSPTRYVGPSQARRPLPNSWPGRSELERGCGTT